jgi:hypothetical protein
MKTKEEISKMREILKSELEGLPDIDYFGASNLKDKAELRAMIIDLTALENGEPAALEEVRDWFNGVAFTSLSDYE